MTLKYTVFITFKNSWVSNSERKVMVLEGRRLVPQAFRDFGNFKSKPLHDSSDSSAVITVI